MFNLVDHAALAPGGCMVCGSTTGPLLDLMQEFSAQQLRLYLCRTHATEVAKAFGLVKGDEHDDLLRVREAITRVNQQLSDEKDRYAALASDAEAMLALNEQLNGELERERGRATQLQDQLNRVREDTMATLDATAPAKEEQDAVLVD